MAKKEGVACKFDPNTEAFQMRAQWKKVDNCRKQWSEQWSWLLDEQKRALEESGKIRQEAADALPKAVSKLETTKSLKPVPLTTTGTIGWLSAKYDTLYQHCDQDTGIHACIRDYSHRSDKIDDCSCVEINPDRIKSKTLGGIFNGNTLFQCGFRRGVTTGQSLVYDPLIAWFCKSYRVVPLAPDL